MPDEQIVLEEEEIKKNAVNERMQNLAKARSEAEAKAEAEAKGRAEAEAKIATMEKEKEFYSSFSDSISKYPQASEYKDSIKEKVMAGYSVEDATVAVLAKEGKFASPAPERETVAGGSAIHQPTSGGSKSVSDMTRDEKRQALMEAEARGDISVS